MKTNQITNNTAIIFTVEPEKVLSDRQLDNRIRKLSELEKTIKELKKEAETIKNEIIAGLHSDHVTTSLYKIHYTTYAEKRIDGTRIKKELPEIAEEYSKETIKHKFSYYPL